MSDLALRTDRLTLGYGTRRVVVDLTLAIPIGSMTAILGPNGCGKSTLLRAFGRLIEPMAGKVTLGGESVQAVDTRALARQIAILPQAPLAPDGIRVGELVRRGRAPWRGFLSSWTKSDEAACAAALDAVSMRELVERPLAELSGGQRQRAWIALVLAQATPILLLDEPTTFLDLPHQIEVLSLLKAGNERNGTTVVSVLHDLNLAARFCTHLVLLGPNGLVATGEPSTVLTAENLLEAFALSALVIEDPVTGTPLVVPR